MDNESIHTNNSININDAQVPPFAELETIDNVPTRVPRIENTVPLSAVDPNN